MHLQRMFAAYVPKEDEDVAFSVSVGSVHRPSVVGRNPDFRFWWASSSGYLEDGYGPRWQLDLDVLVLDREIVPDGPRHP